MFEKMRRTNPKDFPRPDRQAVAVVAKETEITVYEIVVPDRAYHALGLP
jgi:hypothetical protein